MQQKTIKSALNMKGIGLHSGKMISMILKPAPISSGIFFIRNDVKAEHPIIKGDWHSIVDTTLCTKIGNEWGVSIGTIEHLMAALAALGITNLVIEVDGPEIPAMDGSAQPFIDIIHSIGVLSQNAFAPHLKVLKEIHVGDDKKWAALYPSHQLTMEYYFDFTQHCLSLGKQHFQSQGSVSDIMADIGQARTLGFLNEVEYLQSKGFALGGSFENAVVYNDEGVMNPEGLRFEDESVRHKLLDAIGDLYLIGGPLQAHFVGHCSGHKLHHQLMQKLFADQEAWCYIHNKATPAQAPVYQFHIPEWHQEPVFCVA